MLSPLRPRLGRSTNLAKRVLPCLHARYSNIAPNSFRYLAVQGDNARKRLPDCQNRASLRHVTRNSADDILSKALQRCQKTVGKALEEIETSLTNQATNREVNGRRYICDVEQISRWIAGVDRDTHSLMGNRCQYMALCATQILLNCVWNHQSLPDPAGLSLRIVNAMVPLQRRETTWPRARQQLVSLIATVQRYNPLETPFTQNNAEGGQQLGGQMTLFQTPQARLRRVQALIQATDHLFLMERHRFSFSKLTRLSDELVLVTGGLKMMDDRMWLEAHLSFAHEYMLALQSEISMVTESPTSSLTSPNGTQLESIMKLYDLFSSIYKFRAKHG
ncbi:hypothetical protein F5Y08DRAFT_289424 [Xylaria arbuscula]|nr:hypothetical protein F5Y08DRAFT_289424 [Xylaria arbuscula]